MEKKYKGAPFGTQMARFDITGMHPSMKTPGSYIQAPYMKNSTANSLGPGKYEIQVGGFSEQAVNKRSEGPGWARAYEVKRLAAMPHLLHKEQWELKRELKRKLGPGSYDIKDWLQLEEGRAPTTRGMLDTREERFREKYKTELTPGPGTYGKDGIPPKIREDKEKESFGTIGMLDSGKHLKRGLPVVGSRLGPGTYQIDSFTDVLEKHVVGKRGPYEVFSLDRNKPIKTGHFAHPNNANLGPGQYDLKSSVEEWNSQHKKKRGKFGKVAQYPQPPGDRIFMFTLSQKPRNAKDPAPCDYDPKEIEKPLNQGKNLPPFLSSSSRHDKMSIKFFTGNYNSVGAGRYDVQKFAEAQDVNGHTSAFKSKSEKPGPGRMKFLQERIRAKDIPKEERTHLIKPEGPPEALARQSTYSKRSRNQPQVRRSVTVC